MNGFEVYKKFKKSKEYNAGDIYFILLTNQNNTVDDLFLNTGTDKDNKKKTINLKRLKNTLIIKVQARCIILCVSHRKTQKNIIFK